ncbi:Os01g0208133 [Oryza sativa Japonica Group]|uniref:Os01g0208133 protein n=1 Tax=Oryza sativa subsp. japonica TaxID=39947 RepID=C7IXZ2_ORYSJ|nr:Os01g0208133 [Oryza sativa Japonica Group]|eukprot:NP_001172226.1 Os01g0208133 [Oryza sativa Japonica Group]
MVEFAATIAGVCIWRSRSGFFLFYGGDGGRGGGERELVLLLALAPQHAVESSHHEDPADDAAGVDGLAEEEDAAEDGEDEGERGGHGEEHGPLLLDAPRHQVERHGRDDDAGVGDGEEASVEPQPPRGGVPRRRHRRHRQRLRRADHALPRRGQQLVRVLAEHRRHEHGPEQPRHVRQQDQHRPHDPPRPAAPARRSFMAAAGEHAVVDQWAYRRPGVQRDHQHAGQAQANAGRLRRARQAPQPDHFLP